MLLSMVARQRKTVGSVMKTRESLSLVDAGAVSHQHILLIDDIITSGATLTAAAKEVLQGDNVKVSVLSLGFAKNM